MMRYYLNVQSQGQRLILLRHSFLKPPVDLYTARRLLHVARNTISVHNMKTMAILAFYESILTYIAYE